MTRLNYFSIILVVCFLYSSEIRTQKEVSEAEGRYLSELSRVDKVDMKYMEWTTFYSKYSKSKISPFVKTLQNYK